MKKVKKAASKTTVAKKAPEKKSAPVQKPVAIQKPVAAVQKPVPAGKPITDTKEYVEQLELMRDDLLAIIKRKKEEVIPEAEVGDEADVAVRSVERDLVFEQGGNELHLLEEVEAALRRIQKKIFGICEACGTGIAEPRLKAMPYARYCVKCQARFEHS